MLAHFRAICWASLLSTVGLLLPSSQHDVHVADLVIMDTGINQACEYPLVDRYIKMVVQFQIGTACDVHRLRSALCHCLNTCWGKRRLLWLVAHRWHVKW